MKLSLRETQIIQLIANGSSSQHVADTLNLSKHTIHNLRKKMLHRTGCVNITELCARARDQGLIQLSYRNTDQPNGQENK